MTDLEIPLGKKTTKYRFFEMLPAILSYGALIAMVVLSMVSPILASVYLLIIISAVLVKAVGIAYHTIKGRKILDVAQKVNWSSRLSDLENTSKSYANLSKKKPSKNNQYRYDEHLANLKYIGQSDEEYPKPSEIYNAVIIAAYNESYEILQPTIQSVVDTSYGGDHIILVIAYEERGGDEIKKVVSKLKNQYKNDFFAIHAVEHPNGLPDEVIGKGANITYAGQYLSKWLKTRHIASDRVIVTTLDADNRPSKVYFDYLTYEYITHDNRKNLSYQPICLFFTNIWDAPAPMRVIATGNSFWNIISSMRPHNLRNFASHSQPLDALEDMNFWSKRTIVEDGHQYWRSYFHFDGNYSVLPIHVPIYQDAVLCETLDKTLKSQFIQLRRWAYGASDVPYVATRIFTRKRTVEFMDGLTNFIKLLDGHITLACAAILIAIGGWIPLLVNSQAARSVSANQLPGAIGIIQQFATIGLLVSMFVSLKMLPPRPERYKKRRTVAMVAQWILMPFTSIFYNALANLDSQGRLFLARYLDKFDVTEKATIEDVNRAKCRLKTKNR